MMQNFQVKNSLSLWLTKYLSFQVSVIEEIFSKAAKYLLYIFLYKMLIFSVIISQEKSKLYSTG